MKEEKQLTIHEKWEIDSKLPNGGINFDDSECTGEYIEIVKVTKENKTERNFKNGKL